MGGSTARARSGGRSTTTGPRAPPRQPGGPEGPPPSPTLNACNIKGPPYSLPAAFATLLPVFPWSCAASAAGREPGGRLASIEQKHLVGSSRCTLTLSPQTQIPFVAAAYDQVAAPLGRTGPAPHRLAWEVQVFGRRPGWHMGPLGCDRLSGRRAKEKTCDGRKRGTAGRQGGREGHDAHTLADGGRFSSAVQAAPRRQSATLGAPPTNGTPQQKLQRDRCDWQLRALDTTRGANESQAPLARPDVQAASGVWEPAADLRARSSSEQQPFQGCWAGRARAQVS